MNSTVRTLGFLSLILCCGRSPTLETDDAGLQSEDAGVNPDAGSNTELWPVGATQVMAQQSGGFFSFSCASDDGGTVSKTSTWALTIANKTLFYSLCEFGGGGKGQLRSGSRVLSDVEMATFDGAMRNLARSSNTSCGADKELLTLELTTNTGMLRYKDSFYGCEPANGPVLVDHIDNVFDLLTQWSRP